jgi:hypothetical protein
MHPVVSGKTASISAKPICFLNAIFISTSGKSCRQKQWIWRRRLRFVRGPDITPNAPSVARRWSETFFCSK